jgi:CDGSH-type Zn-finger protein
MSKKKKIIITKDGPYIASGGLPLAKEIAVVGSENFPETWEKGENYETKDSYRLCRCGGSKNKPFCDDTHYAIKFDGAETADKNGYLDRAEKITGPELDLTDERSLCSVARFCYLAGGTWKNTERSNDPEAKNKAIETACNCPSGRLVVWDKKTGKPIEPDFEPMISVTEDPQKKVSGPLWLKGGVELESADGEKYETRNRVTLCRCGQSKNKPFCDGRHIPSQFNDGDPSLK